MSLTLTKEPKNLTRRGRQHLTARLHSTFVGKYMLEIGTIIGVIAILITILLSEPALKRLRGWTEDRKRQRWSADLQVEKGKIPELHHYAYEYWRQEVEVDDHGNALHYVEARLHNISGLLCEELRFPVYCDATDVVEAEIAPWAASGKVKYEARVVDWNSANSRGRVLIRMSPPLPPGQRRKLRWGYKLPRTFSAGDEYYNIDVAAAHYELSGRINFSNRWLIQYVGWSESSTINQDSPRILGNAIEWKVSFPAKGERVGLRFGLATRTKNANKTQHSTAGG